MDRTERDRLVDAWGSMGVLWGINRSMARVHALLIATEAPLSLDDIADALAISRGNASMSLKELRNWGVIRRIHQPGDRRDYYVTEPDIWRMFFRIVAERKKREFDPVLAMVREALARPNPSMGREVRQRLADMENLLSTADRFAKRFLADEQASRALLQLLTDQLLGPSGE